MEPMRFGKRGFRLEEFKDLPGAEKTYILRVPYNGFHVCKR